MKTPHGRSCGSLRLRGRDLDTDDEQGGSVSGVSADLPATPRCMEVADTDDEDGGSGVSADPPAAPDSASSATENCSSVEGNTATFMSVCQIQSRRPRRFNRAADRLARTARLQQHGTFVHSMLGS